MEVEGLALRGFSVVQVTLPWYGSREMRGAAWDQDVGLMKFGEQWGGVMCEESLGQLPVSTWEMGLVAPFNKIRNEWGWERRLLGKVI